MRRTREQRVAAPRKPVAKRGSTRTTCANVAFLAGFVAFASQIIGVYLVHVTPLDNQGAVGKAFVSLAIQFIAYPAGVAGIILAVVSQVGHPFSSVRAVVGCALGLAGLVPFPLLFLCAVMR
jgi:hypothetical protein